MAVTLPFATTDLAYPFSYLRMLMGSLVSQGVVHAGDMLVSPSSGLQAQISAGEAFVPQTVATEGLFYRGLYFVMNDAVVNPYNTISAPTVNPRIDQVILRVYDVPELGGSGSSYARFEWLAGTETSGATLANLSGAATLPYNSMTMAYVLQTVGEGSISSGNILNVPSVISPLQNAANPGDLIYSAASTRPGALLTDGTAYSRVGYGNLFGVIGTAYGVGDGSTTFNVPDFRGRTILAAGTGVGLTARARGNTGGEETHLLAAAELPEIGVEAPYGIGFVVAVSAGATEWILGTGGGGDTGVTLANNTQDLTGALDMPHNNLQPFGVANIFIKY